MTPSIILERFMERSPIPVMVRAFLERVLNMDKLNDCLKRVTKKQYTRELLFSSVFELMSLVVFKNFRLINAAYQTKQASIGVSITSVYNKLNGLETDVAAALVRDTAREFNEVTIPWQSRGFTSFNYKNIKSPAGGQRRSFLRAFHQKRTPCLNFQTITGS